MARPPAMKQRVLRFFKLYPLVGQDDEGLQKFATYLCKSFSQTVGHMEQSPARHSHAVVLTALFETVANVFEAHRAVIDSNYGVGKSLFILDRLNFECLRRATETLDLYLDSRDFQKSVADVQSALQRPKFSRSSAGVSSDVEPELEPRVLDGILNELAMLSQRSQLYNRFLQAQLNVRCQQSLKTFVSLVV